MKHIYGRYIGRYVKVVDAEQVMIFRYLEGVVFPLVGISTGDE